MAIDFLFAAMIFILILNAALAIWSNEADFIQNELSQNELENKAGPAIDLLVRTSGTPNDWELRSIDDAEIVGLAKSDRNLDPEKVKTYCQWASVFWSDDYNKLKAKMLIDHDFHFKLSDETGAVIKETGSPPETFLGSVWSANVKRIVKYGEDAAIAEFRLFHQK